MFITLCIPFILATLWAITDAAQKEFGTMGKKVQWMFVAAIPFVGFMIYLLFGFRKGQKPNEA
ncbi:PLDc N-terminal domain-containing protein [Thermodesulfobacteriota bacterium]